MRRVSTGMRTGKPGTVTNAPFSSTCGARPGEKMRVRKNSAANGVYDVGLEPTPRGGTVWIQARETQGKAAITGCLTLPRYMPPRLDHLPTIVATLAVPQ